MSNNKLYEQLNQAAGQESMEFDQAVMWSAIESELDKKRRPFGFFILLFGAAIAIGLTGFYFVNNNMRIDQRADTSASTAHQNLEPKKDNTNLVSSALITSEEAKTEVVPTTDNAIKNNALPTTENTNNNKLAQSTIQLNQTTSKNPSRSISNKKDELAINKNQLKTSFVNELAAKSIERTANIINRPENSSTSAIIPSTIDQENEVSSDEKEMNTKLAITTAIENSTSTSTEFIAQKSATDQLNSSAINLLTVNESKLAYQPLANKRDWSRCEINSPWSFLVEAYGGFGYPIMQHEMTDPTEPSTYLEDWEEAQSPVGGFQVGAALVVRSPGGFEFSGGFEYQHVVQKIESESTVTGYFTWYNPMAYFIIETDGTKTWYGDTTTSLQITTEKRTNEIRHKLINIPIKIGYVAPFGDWNLGVHAGVILHLSHVVEGIILQSDDSYLEIDKNNSELLYKKDIGLSYTADFHIGRQVTDNVELFIRPEFRFHPNAWTSTTNDISTKIQLAQLQAGVRYLIK